MALGRTTAPFSGNVSANQPDETRDGAAHGAGTCREIRADAPARCTVHHRSPPRSTTAHYGTAARPSGAASRARARAPAPPRRPVPCPQVVAVSAQYPARFVATFYTEPPGVVTTSQPHPINQCRTANGRPCLQSRGPYRSRVDPGVTSKGSYQFDLTQSKPPGCPIGPSWPNSSLQAPWGP